MSREMALELSQQVLEALSNKQAVGIFNSNLDDSDEIVLYNENLDVRILRVKKISKDKLDKKICTNWYAAFNMSKIFPEAIITLEVPKTKEGLFAGLKRWQLKEWCKELNVKYINIVGKEEL